jgi:hypothetical protein
MATPSPSKKDLWAGTISDMAAVITLPHIAASTVSSMIVNHIPAAKLIDEIWTIISFILISFPLTMAAALITLAIVEKEFKISIAITSIILAGILSNLLALIIPDPKFSNPSMFQIMEDSSREIKGLPMFFLMAYKIIAIWWEAYGPLLFIQSIIVGGIFGYRVAEKT